MRLLKWELSELARAKEGTVPDIFVKQGNRKTPVLFQGCSYLFDCLLVFFIGKLKLRIVLAPYRPMELNRVSRFARDDMPV
jgi:hypothetical protein